MELKKPLIMDGAMGTELIRRGLKLPLPLWSSLANIEHNNQVINVHKDYIDAGSDIITTNTFRTTSRTFIKAGYTQKDAGLISKQCFDMAIKAAKYARNYKKTLIAGSIAPLEDCYVPDDFPGKQIATKELREISESMVKSEVDIILFETMGCFEEIESALNVSDNINIPRWLSIVLKDKHHILDGTSVKKVIDLAGKKNIEILLVNCTPAWVINDALDVVLEFWEGKWGVYPNAGKDMPTKEGNFSSTLDDDSFGNVINHYIKLGASVVGSCCGSTPKTIRKIYNMIQKL